MLSPPDQTCLMPPNAPTILAAVRSHSSTSAPVLPPAHSKVTASVLPKESLINACCTFGPDSCCKRKLNWPVPPAIDSNSSSNSAEVHSRPGGIVKLYGTMFYRSRQWREALPRRNRGGGGTFENRR
eukprot:scaffold61712_cov69-Phaeocystis_antarctica.AAC.7